MNVSVLKMTAQFCGEFCALERIVLTGFGFSGQFEGCYIVLGVQQVMLLEDFSDSYL